LKSAFIANVSHELRTPLTSIIGYLQLLMDNEILSREGSKYMDIILNNSTALVKLIDGLIDLAKIEAGVFDLLMEKNNLNNLVEYICDSHRPLAAKKGLKLEYKLQSYEDEFFFDAKRIEQVLNNLISNAIKFTPEGGNVHITTSYDNKYAIVAVKDTGIGISRKDQKMIFDRFSRVDNIDTKQYEGVGIGLYLSREIIEFHNGKIWFKSKAGKWSTFYFKIPIIKNASQIDQSNTNHVIMA
jgi:signal transduction histidine kinase